MTPPGLDELVRSVLGPDRRTGGRQTWSSWIPRRPATPCACWKRPELAPGVGPGPPLAPPQVPRGGGPGRPRRRAGGAVPRVSSVSPRCCATPRRTRFVAVTRHGRAAPAGDASGCWRIWSASLASRCRRAVIVRRGAGGVRDRKLRRDLTSGRVRYHPAPAVFPPPRGARRSPSGPGPGQADHERPPRPTLLPRAQRRARSRSADVPAGLPGLSAAPGARRWTAASGSWRPTPRCPEYGAAEIQSRLSRTSPGSPTAPWPTKPWSGALRGDRDGAPHEALHPLRRRRAGPRPRPRQKRGRIGPDPRPDRRPRGVGGAHPLRRRRGAQRSLAGRSSSEDNGPSRGHGLPPAQEGGAGGRPRPRRPAPGRDGRGLLGAGRPGRPRPGGGSRRLAGAGRPRCSSTRAFLVPVRRVARRSRAGSSAGRRAWLAAGPAR